MLAVGLSGCTGVDPNNSPPSTLPGLATPSVTSRTKPTTSEKAEAADYRPLLLTAADLTDAEDTFNHNLITILDGFTGRPHT